MTQEKNIALPAGDHLEQGKNTAVSREHHAMGIAKKISPIIISVFAVYLTIGMTLGSLPFFIKNTLHFNSLVVGMVIGLQSLATLLTRAYSGRLTDTRGAKRCHHLGILLVIFSGLAYLAASVTASLGIAALALVVLARIVHGIAESLTVTGALTWGIGLVGVQNSGKVMTWNGIAMYAGIAIGAPCAIWLGGTLGIQYVFTGIVLLSVISWLSTVTLPELAVDAAHVRTPFYKVIGQIAGQGSALACSSIAFACISSFIALTFSSRNWGNPSLAFMTFGGSYILIRLFFASFPDKFGGYRVAMVSLLIELSGQLLVSFAPSAVMSVIGCGLTGVGFSLIFPSLGVIAIRKVSPQMRGTALGAYAAFFDLSLGLAAPLAGLIAGWFSYQAVYLFGAVSCLAALIIVMTQSAKNE
jgi:MFS family permease